MVPFNHAAAATGRSIARWLIVCVGLAAFCSSAPMAAPDTPPSVTVTEIDGVYNVHAVFTVAQSVDDAIAVLTDYARIPKFMPDVLTSEVIERTPHGLVVEQSAISKFMMFSKRVHLVLEVTEQGGLIRFRDRCGQSFTSYEGAWIVTPRPGGASITYHLMTKPAFEVPGFVLKRLLKRDAAVLIDRIKVEIASRANRDR